MDIFKYAEDIDYSADYMDMNTGLIYKIKNYGLALKRGLPVYGIEVIDPDGASLGYVYKEE